MRILVTGCNGFIGSVVAAHLKQKGHRVYATNRKTLDITDEIQLDEFFSSNKIDVVIHAAAMGGRRNRHDTAKDMYDNILMFENLASQSSKYKLLISFGSGAELDRRYDIHQFKEEHAEYRIPKDYYGLSKRIISQRMQNYDNMINLRIFNCFGPTEAKDRMVRASIERSLDSEQIVVHQNKMMDFFYIGDLCKVIDLYIENKYKTLPKNVNMSYMRKRTLVDIALYINNLTNNSKSVIINTAGYSRPYCGDGTVLYSLLGNKLEGLNEGIKKTYKELKNGR